MVIASQVNFRLLDNMINKLFISFLLLSFTFSGVGTTAGEWLEIDTGIRSIGMGTAQTASGRGISASAYNPANLAFIDKQEVFFNRTNYIVGMSHVFMGYAGKSKPMEKISISKSGLVFRTHRCYSTNMATKKPL